LERKKDRRRGSVSAANPEADWGSNPPRGSKILGNNPTDPEEPLDMGTCSKEQDSLCGVEAPVKARTGKLEEGEAVASARAALYTVAGGFGSLGEQIQGEGSLRTDPDNLVTEMRLASTVGGAAVVTEGSDENCDSSPCGEATWRSKGEDGYGEDNLPGAEGGSGSRIAGDGVEGEEKARTDEVDEVTSHLSPLSGFGCIDTNISTQTIFCSKRLKSS